MRLKSILFVHILITLLLLSTFLFSCKDDSVSSSSELTFASPRFNWKIDTLLTTTRDLVVIDTNNYFTLSNYYNLGELRHYKNGIMTEYYSDVISEAIEGTDENAIYMGGNITVTEPDITIPVLLKFSNGGFTQIKLGCDTMQDNRVRDLLMVKNKNELWGVTARGEAFRYDGSTVSRYRVETDTLYYPYLITNDIYNNIYMFMGKEIDSNGMPLNEDLRVYLYHNNIWSIIYNQINTANDDITFYKGAEDRTFCRRTLNNYYVWTYDFSLGNFSRLFDNTSGIWCDKAGGKSLNDLMIAGVIINGSESERTFSHWDGVCLSNENKNIINKEITESCLVKKIIEKDKRYFILLWDEYFTEYSYLLKGVPIK
jgi:hypothetical protein